MNNEEITDVANDLKEEIENALGENLDISNAEKLILAQLSLRLSIALAKNVAENTHNAHAEAYLVDHMEIMADSNHRFLSRDFNFEKWIDELEE